MPVSKLLTTFGLPAALLVLMTALAGCEPPRAAAAPPPPPQVTVAKPAKRLVADRDEYVGRFVAVDAIEVRARVSGYLDAVHFTDGQLVKKGDLLFTIDRRPFEAALAQAQASLAQARANLAYAEADLERGQSLVRGTSSRSRPSTSARRPSGWRRPPSRRRRRPCNRPRSTSSSPSCAPLYRGASATGAWRPAIWSPAGRRAPRHCSPPSRRSIPIRFEFTMDETSYLRFIRARRRWRRYRQPRRRCPGHTEAHRRGQIYARGQDGLPRQRHRSCIGHHSRPRPIRQPRWNP